MLLKNLLSQIGLVLPPVIISSALGHIKLLNHITINYATMVIAKHINVPTILFKNTDGTIL